MTEETPAGHESPASDRGTVQVPIEISAALVNLINQVRDEDETLEGFIENAAEMGARRALWDDKVVLDVPVPDDAQETVELLQEHFRVQHGSELVYTDALSEVTNLRYQPPGETGPD